MFTLKISFEDKGSFFLVLDQVAPGQSLLEICLKQGIAIGHKCGGMCFCSTCQVFIESGGEYLEPKSIREKHFIARATDPQANSRLACQCMILEEDSGGLIEIVIPSQKGD